MNKVTTKFFGILLLACIALCSCNPDSSSNGSGSPTGGNNSNGYDYGTTTLETVYYTDSTVDVRKGWNSYSPNSGRDIANLVNVSTLEYDKTFYVKLSDMSVSTDNTTFTKLTDGCEAETLLKNYVTASLSDGVLTIDSSSYESNYIVNVTGKTSAGSLCINSNDSSVVKIVLNKGASITSGNYPCIEVTGKSVVYLFAEGNNTLEDGRSYGTGYSSEDGVGYTTDSSKVTKKTELTQKWAKGSDTKGTVYTKGSLILDGSGSLTLTLTEGYKHGFYAKDYIRVVGGTYTVNTSGRNAFQSVNGFVMDGGSIKVTGTGNNTNNESRGIVVEGSEDNKGEGYIVINGGTLDITTVSKGITAKWDVDDDADTTVTTDDPYPYVLIKGGDISVTTTGDCYDESATAYTFTNADGVEVSENTKLSPEGIEGKQAVFISGGTVTLKTTDDCINSSSTSARIEISGGNIYACSSDNDAIDSNGTLTIKGGLVVASTKTTPECAFDCDNNTFSITGGLVVGIGTSNYTAPKSCTQSTVVLSGNYFGAGGTTFAIEDASGNAVFAYDVPTHFGTSSNSSYIMVLSSPKIKASTTYKAVSGVSATGGTKFHGLYTTLPTVTGGSSTTSNISTSTSNYVCTLSSGSNGGAQDGTHPNPGPGAGGGGQRW